MEMGEAVAIHNLGCYYAEGIHGLPQDWAKALVLYHRAAELGHVHSYHSIGLCYYNGIGVERDIKKAIHYWELAAMGGVVKSRHNLGNAELRAGNYDRALKHYMINVEFGNNRSLKNIKQMYSNGYATRDDYAKALHAYQAYLSAIKSDDRDKAVTYSDNYKYYE